MVQKKIVDAQITIFNVQLHQICVFHTCLFVMDTKTVHREKMKFSTVISIKMGMNLCLHQVINHLNA